MVPCGSACSRGRQCEAGGVYLPPAQPSAARGTARERVRDPGTCLAVQMGRAWWDPSRLLPSAPLAGRERVDEAPTAGNLSWDFQRNLREVSVCVFYWQPERFWSQPYRFVLISKWAFPLQ